MKEIRVKPPQISERTHREMTEFFMRTSIPRILKRRAEEERKKKEENQHESIKNSN
ncbi:hypothetical protein [Bacillus thuringiensis]|uniref:hypothetical protein n=1 Tax=Bacillus thuringiensis TaxID=1428 RepID=UPI0026E21723|nr:hypothetical protein [Bacillus thuringiensis]MDO6634123.1 hypothetical protein [Bacillus thuringiensis]MDO6663557.1 hypothetical protein [Bacillus thuringiensis]MDO6704270.1 hypothetical protein [Bacillus thuringiensis]